MIERERDHAAPASLPWLSFDGSVVAALRFHRAVSLPPIPTIDPQKWPFDSSTWISTSSRGGHSSNFASSWMHPMSIIYTAGHPNAGSSPDFSAPMVAKPASPTTSSTGSAKLSNRFTRRGRQNGRRLIIDALILVMRFPVPTFPGIRHCDTRRFPGSSPWERHWHSRFIHGQDPNETSPERLPRTAGTLILLSFMRPAP